ncbi:MAG: ATP-binding protein, partial [Candidatus Eremiobacterota bacterium]
DGMVIFLGSEAGGLEPCRATPPQLAAEPARAVAAAVLANLKPLLIDDLASTRFPPLGHRSVLAAPLLGEQGTAGVLLVTAAPTSAYTRSHQDLLQILGYQAAAALNSARLHQETREAFRKLQESEAQLVHSSKMAAVGQLAAGIAHELNTPLGTVVLSLDMLGSMVDQPRACERIEMATREAMRAQTIVDTLLLYSRETSRQRTPVDLNRLVRDTLLLVDYQLRQGGASVELALASLPQVTCNANEIQQVLINLLLNARDAVEGQPPERRVLQVCTHLEGDQAVLEVHDGGTGVPADVRDRIFDPFFTTKPVGRGTGLGLSLSHQLATAHGGELSFRDRPGGGTVFSLRLPT